jgi:hypothetical protein
MFDKASLINGDDDDSQAYDEYESSEDGGYSGEEVINEEFLAECWPQIERLVKEQISQYFKEKELHCGGPLSDFVLHSDHYINQVSNTDLATCVEKAYKTLAAFGHEAGIKDDIGLVLSILAECSESGILKCFAGGILLMHIELLEGLEILELDEASPLDAVEDVQPDDDIFDDLFDFVPMMDEVE